ncbi:MAG: GTP-sensing pleiotropic transcriptional regulator CodY [Firmicutes bacterium]|nr:GTP-sensing pleiotropic transcriptional regulator CodY [Bacillota bacterium]
MINSPMLEKTRLINKILQNTKGQYVDFKEIALVLKDVIQANVYIADNEGNILGYAVLNEFECEIMVNEVLNKGFFPKRYNDFLLREDELRDNLKVKTNKCAFLEETDCIFTNKILTVIPIIGGGQRQGTLLLARFGIPFNDEDLILAERGATVIGMEILRARAEEIEEEARNRAVIKLAVDTLSYSELEAVQEVFKELEGDEGLLVASKIADQLGITRSVIVNALRKLESAGIVESRSLGMKGTHIKVLNPYLQEYLEK